MKISGMGREEGMFKLGSVCQEKARDWVSVGWDWMS